MLAGKDWKDFQSCFQLALKWRYIQILQMRIVIPPPARPAQARPVLDRSTFYLGGGDKWLFDNLWGNKLTGLFRLLKGLGN
jgi:hypothetical protein